jgi:O-antigen/teichoic acid export membrane protein
MLTMVTNAVIQPITPQLTKSYAAGNFQNADRLLILSVKLGYFSMFIIGAPLLLEMEWLLDLWLGEVPQYAVLFSRLLVVDAMIISLNSGISTIIFADGDIKLYQISINTLRLVSLFVGYLVLKNGQGAEWLLIVYIIFSVAIFFTMQYVLHVTLNYSNQILFKQAYLPSILITIAFIPFVLITTNFSPFLRMSVAVIYSLLLIYLLGFSEDERMTINRVVYKLVRK